MTAILFIKTSSLGDVIHHMPAVADARARFPDARIAWVVEEAYAPLVRLHPAVDEVIPVAERRWRRSLYLPAWREMHMFGRALRANPFDTVIDTQGLLRTGLIARLAHGRRHGYDAASIKESLASRCYDVHHAVSRELHAIERNRLLTGASLGYMPEQRTIDYGLERARLRTPAQRPYAVLVHASAQPKKRWVEARWSEVARALAGRGLEIMLPWSEPDDRVAAHRIAARLSAAHVPERAPLDAMAWLMAGATLVIGVDTGLSHLAAALGVPLVAIFAASEPGLTGPRGSGPIAIVGAQGTPPSVRDVMTAIDQVTRA